MNKRASTGKIARLPHDIREQLNQRLRDGKSGPEILPWLNELPAVKEILAAQFKSKPVNAENLSNWRGGGYKIWCEQKEEVTAAKELCLYAGEFTEAGGGRFAPAAAAMASGKLFKFLNSANAAQTDPNELVKCAAAASALLKGEQGYARIGLAKERIRIRDMQLILKRDKQQRDVIAISTDKYFKLILSTTPPEFDDTHYSFELLAPPAGATFKPDASGNWYTSESGIYVHRADAFDTALAGKKIFDLKTGDEISPVEALDRAPNKDGHRIAHWLTWMLGGSAACDLNRLKTAQERGSGQSQNFQIGTDADMIPALNWLYQNLGGRPNASPSPGGDLSRLGSGERNPPEGGGPQGPSERARASQRRGEGELNTVYGGASVPASRSGSSLVTYHSSLRIGIGFDVATTTKGKSNPSVVSIMEEHGPQWLVRARFIWKTRDPETANQRLHSILDVLDRRGLRPRALAQDATNERYYAEQNRKHFRKRLPVILVVASEAVEKPGLDKPTNWKEYLGNQLIAKLDENNLTLPPDDYTRTDYRLIIKDRGKFVCEPNDQGMHGDCFDADKLAGHALAASSSNRTIVAPVQSQILNPKFQVPHLL